MKDKMKQRRVIFIDYIRALAILMVIMCHVIDVNCLFWLGYQDMSGARQIILYTLLIFGRCGVPLFLMITGYLLLDRDYSQGKWKSFYLHKWLHLFLLTEIWFIIYEGFSVFVQGNPFVGKYLGFIFALACFCTGLEKTFQSGMPHYRHFAMGTCIVAAEFCPREYGATYNLCPVYADWRSIQEVEYSVGRTQKSCLHHIQSGRYFRFGWM